ncbi:unnamed protein product [Pleuronectes platessa]|uniref:Uncharacterized protein n=1 Tax=Pleuronectes platessa TaxID=8262 RepID=A0A9N7YJR7_PLEPL|nr:unnamed protein product [Pleuronectes platessa]
MSSSGEVVFRALETPLLCLGAVTAAWFSVCTVCRLLTGFRLWVLGNGRLVSPTQLGKWAGSPMFVFVIFAPCSFCLALLQPQRSLAPRHHLYAGRSHEREMGTREG